MNMFRDIMTYIAMSEVCCVTQKKKDYQKEEKSKKTLRKRAKNKRARNARKVNK